MQLNNDFKKNHCHVVGPHDKVIFQKFPTDAGNLKDKPD